MKGGKFKLAVQVQEEAPKQAFHVSNTGTFREGDLVINSKGLLINGSSPSTRTPNKPPPSTIEQSSSSQHVKDDGSFQLKDLMTIKVLGQGAGGVVQKTLHVPSNRIVALKVIPMDVSENVRKQIILELRTLSQNQSPDIVSFFDAFFSEGNIFIALEYMDAGSLADVMKVTGCLSEQILAHITHSVLKGLAYLHKTLHLIHRDIKPSNLLLNTKGEAKIADFGVSGQLAHTLSQAVSWVGTVTYMSPERITGSSYSSDSDIWSLGLTLIECAIGRFPYGGSTPMGFWELLDYIVKSPVPTLPADKFSPEFCSFVAACLQKDPANRPSATLLLSHPFIKKYESDKFNMAAWVQSFVPKGN